MAESTNNTVLTDITDNGVATITLNRVDKSNAFDASIIQSLTHEIDTLSSDIGIRCLVLRGNGKHFSAGADLHWMKSMANKSKQENQDDAVQLAKLMQALDNFPHPTIAVVHGSAFGGALGLICCCDIALGTESSIFCLSEVKIGLIPATIGPYVCRAIGQRHARRYMLTGERIEAKTAVDIGLLHYLCSHNTLQESLNHILKQILSNSPAAVSKAKTLCQLCDSTPIDTALINETSQMIADIRVSKQGQEGLNAYFEKRLPNWVK
ncbi:enoyl-CoA hydratase/isomerase family protein [Vibrio sp. SCSIO 43135]|uniref:enoyl-CoA hydratase-related protein n=1 Tax=Vibrio sp. SCSIO 43135 TaxID=2819096 RepID=UPI002075AC83|nr:enoyl-CoA hydratase-related protein [Vibrio sp. SCSIO 43135]USD42651.1 enoyl-CoA hydratase/isomerase family protein [Vibrio sp. SCSIO 43135]